VKVQNIGRGPAYDIDVSPIVLIEQSRGPFTHKFYLNDHALESGKEEDLRMRVVTPDGGVEMSNMMTFLSRLVPKDYVIKTHKDIQAETPALFLLNYKGMNGRRYHSVYRMYSVLPPVGNIVMQLLHQGNGKRGILRTRWYHLVRPAIPHEVNKQPPKESLILKFIVFVHRRFR
jgi:hypothetical protein